MKKKFRLVLDLEADIEIWFKGKKSDQQRNLELLLDEFLKDKQAVLEFYRVCVLIDLQGDNYIGTLQKDLESRDEEDILLELVHRLPNASRDYWLKVFNREDDPGTEEIEDFFNLVSSMSCRRAELMEVDE
jgi:hypothetical protein